MEPRSGPKQRPVGAPRGRRRSIQAIAHGRHRETGPRGGAGPTPRGRAQASRIFPSHQFLLAHASLRLKLDSNPRKRAHASLHAPKVQKNIRVSSANRYTTRSVTSRGDSNSRREMSPFGRPLRPSGAAECASRRRALGAGGCGIRRLCPSDSGCVGARASVGVREVLGSGSGRGPRAGGSAVSDRVSARD